MSITATNKRRQRLPGTQLARSSQRLSGSLLGLLFNQMRAWSSRGKVIMVAVQGSAGRGTAFQEDFTTILLQRTEEKTIEDDDINDLQVGVCSLF